MKHTEEWFYWLAQKIKKQREPQPKKRRHILREKNHWCRYEAKWILKELAIRSPKGRLLCPRCHHPLSTTTTISKYRDPVVYQA
jgi:hypothetical protein